MIVFCFACVLSETVSTMALAGPQPGATIYVAQTGNDTWSGTLADPNVAKTDGPVATLEGARDKIRAIKKKGKLPTGGVTVVMRGGKYCLPRTFELGKEDSGEAAAPIVYRAADGETVEKIGPYANPLRASWPIVENDH